MNENFVLCLSVEPDNMQLSKLNKRLEKVGMKIEYAEMQEKDGSVFRYAMITCNTEEFIKKTKRNAGKKQKKLFLSTEEIRERMKTETSTELANELGINRSTLFRRLKQMNDEPDI